MHYKKHLKVKNMTRSEAIGHLKNIAIYSVQDGYTDEARQALDMAIEALEEPERKKGKWINHRNDDGHNIADCDQCGNAIQWFDGDEIPRYCYMCGADMRGEQDEHIG